jgi:hypothetical protein
VNRIRPIPNVICITRTHAKCEYGRPCSSPTCPGWQPISNKVGRCRGTFTKRKREVTCEQILVGLENHSTSGPSPQSGSFVRVPGARWDRGPRQDRHAKVDYATGALPIPTVWRTSKPSNCGCPR